MLAHDWWCNLNKYLCFRSLRPTLNCVRSAIQQGRPDNFLAASVQLRGGTFSFLAVGDTSEAGVSLWVILEQHAQAILRPKLIYNEKFKSFDIKISSEDIALIEKELCIKFLKNTEQSFAAVMAELNALIEQAVFTHERASLDRNQSLIFKHPGALASLTDHPTKIYLKGIMEPTGRPRSKTINKLFLGGHYPATYDGKMAIVNDCRQRNLTLIWTEDKTKQVTFPQALIRWMEGKK